MILRIAFLPQNHLHVYTNCSKLRFSTKRHYERRLLPYSPRHCFDVVANVSKYKEFVPWVKNSVIVSNSHDIHDLQSSDSSIFHLDKQKQIDAELEVGFGMFSEKYISHVTLIPYSQVTAISNQTNLFDSLRTEWKFASSKDPHSCWVTFQVDFQFKSAIYDKLSEMFLDDVVANMVKAFERQCDKVSHTEE